MSVSQCAYCSRASVAGAPFLGIFACREHERELSRVVGDFLKLGDHWKAKAAERAARSTAESPL